jgi:hypothetical protein
MDPIYANAIVVFPKDGKWYKIVYLDGVISERYVSNDDKVTWVVWTEGM